MHDEYLENFRAGDPLAASRLMSIVERGGPPAQGVLDAVYPLTGAAHRIAVTGGTGAGKSTLIDAFVARFRGAGERVGVVAEDPTSPLCGGAILGDRIRMQSAVGDPGVFVRSIASRGGDTGFSTVAVDLADVLDAFGCGIVLLETTGVGQNEHRVRHAADSVVVVLTPEAGDDVQGLKAGILEIADVIAVNKRDRPGAEAFAADLADTLSMREPADGWSARVVTTCATRGDGIGDVFAAIAAHENYLRADGRRAKRRAEGLYERVRAIALARAAAALQHDAGATHRIVEAVRAIESGALTPWRAAATVVEALWHDGDNTSNTDHEVIG